MGTKRRHLTLLLRLVLPVAAGEREDGSENEKHAGAAQQGSHAGIRKHVQKLSAHRNGNAKRRFLAPGKGFAPALAKYLHISPAALYERQRELVRTAADLSTCWSAPSRATASYIGNQVARLNA
jgi:hypothetical protein